MAPAGPTTSHRRSRGLIVAGSVICIVGAESTGKSTLALALCEALNAGAPSRPRCAHVDEALRSFCIRNSRTPTLDEQIEIAAEQSRRIATAAQRHDIVIADTSALMTAVYSDYVFGDTSLYGSALATQSGYALTLLTALDLPWQPDGLQRDGAHVRQPVDTLIRRALQHAGLGWSVVAGQGAARLANATAAVDRVLTARSARSASADTGSGTDDNGTCEDAAAYDGGSGLAGWRHVCTRCGDGSCERRLLALNRRTRGA